MIRALVGPEQEPFAVSRTRARILGPVSVVVLALSAACGSGTATTLHIGNDAGLGSASAGYDATTGLPGDDGSMGTSSGSSSGAGDDASDANAPTDATLDSSGDSTAPGDSASTDTGDDAIPGSGSNDATGASDGSSSGASGSSGSSGGGSSGSASSGSSSSGGGSSGTGSSSGGSMCVPACQTDQDCQNSCPAAPGGGFNCCDVSSFTCFASQSRCPSQTDGAPE